MKIGNIQLPYFIQDIKEHNDIKDMLLKMIEEDPGVPTGQNANDNNDDDNISKTDYYLDVTNMVLRPYQKFWIDIFAKYRDEMGNYLNLIPSDGDCDEPGTCGDEYGCLYTDMWYQQYLQNDFQGWHVHPNSSWSSVYYLELLNDNCSTKFYKWDDGSVYNIKVKEGQVLTFPAQVLHSSPPNDYFERKTTIVTNHNFEELKDDIQE